MNQEEFAALITEHQKLIYKVCHLYASAPQDVEDLFQEIVLNLWRALPSFSGRARITTWMYRVALNTAITQLRKSSRRRNHEIEHDLRFLASHDPIYNEQAQALYAAIKQLGKVDRALVLLYLEDCSYREIANIIGISESNVGVKLNRIKKKLKRLTTGAA